MRWFKHLSVAQRDPDMQLLISEYGYEGYGVYWSILEILAENLKWGTETKQSFPVKTWKNHSISDRKWLKIAQFLSEKGKINLKIDGKIAIIECRNMLKIRDEYTKKLNAKQ